MSFLDEVLAELAKAKVHHPAWPTDPIHAAAILGEEYGEMTKALVECIYEHPKSTTDDIRKEAIQTAAMALRWIENFDHYKFQFGERICND